MNGKDRHEWRHERKGRKGTERPRGEAEGGRRRRKQEESEKERRGKDGMGEEVENEKKEKKPIKTNGKGERIIKILASLATSAVSWRHRGSQLASTAHPHPSLYQRDDDGSEKPCTPQYMIFFCPRQHIHNHHCTSAIMIVLIMSGAARWIATPSVATSVSKLEQRREGAIKKIHLMNPCVVTYMSTNSSSTGKSRRYFCKHKIGIGLALGALVRGDSTSGFFEAGTSSPRPNALNAASSRYRAVPITSGTEGLINHHNAMVPNWRTQ